MVVFPTIMRPHPALRLPADIILQELHEGMGVRIWARHFAGERVEFLECKVVMSATCFNDIKVEHVAVYVTTEVLSSCVVRAFLPHEEHCLVAAGSSLVSNERHHKLLLPGVKPKEGAQGSLRRNPFVRETGAHRLDYLVSCFRLCRLIQRCQKERMMAEEGDALHPFPVTHMSHEEYEWTAVLRHLLHEIHVGEAYTTAYLFVTEVQEFDAFHEHIAEMMVEVALYPAPFLLRILGEGIAQIGPYHLASVAYDMMKEAAHDVADSVEHAPREVCQRT